MPLKKKEFYQYTPFYFTNSSSNKWYTYIVIHFYYQQVHFCYLRSFNHRIDMVVSWLFVSMHRWKFRNIILFIQFNIRKKIPKPSNILNALLAHHRLSFFSHSISSIVCCLHVKIIHCGKKQHVIWQYPGNEVLLPNLGPVTMYDYGMARGMVYMNLS